MASFGHLDHLELRACQAFISGLRWHLENLGADLVVDVPKGMLVRWHPGSSVTECKMCLCEQAAPLASSNENPSNQVP